MSLKYHPDKDGDNEKFIKIMKHLKYYMTMKRKLYDLKLLFKDIDLTEDDYNIIFSYYNRFVESKEYKLINYFINLYPKM